MIGFPFDSHVEYDENGIPVYDRAITSEPYRMLLKHLFKTGIMPDINNNLLVQADVGMVIKVNPGFAMVEGCMKLEEDERSLQLQAADANYDRIDSVVMRLDDNDDVRECDLYIKTGVPQNNPVRPEMTRNNSIYEIGLADIYVTARMTEVVNYLITDTRYENERCGIVSSISEFDTERIYQQVQSDLAYFKNVEEASFEEWFDRMKDQLSEDAAGHLQAEIDDINTDLLTVARYKQGEEPTTPVPRDADTLGGRYTAEDIDEINENLEHLQSGKMLSAIAIPSGIVYNAPSDGYVQMYIKLNQEMDVSIGSSDGSVNGIRKDIKANMNMYDAIFVKKGMKIKCTYTSTIGSLLFVPIS